MRPFTFSVAPSGATDADGICLSQTPVGPSDLTLNGILVTSGVATLDPNGNPRRVTITSGGDDRTINYTVFGTLCPDSAVVTSKTLAGSNASVVNFPFFYTVTRVAVDGKPASTVTVGIDLAASNPIPLDQGQDPMNTSLFFGVTGTIDFTLQYTGGDVFDPTSVPLWLSDATVAAKTADTLGNTTQPCQAIRILVNSFSAGGEVSCRVTQATQFR